MDVLDLVLQEDAAQPIAPKLQADFGGNVGVDMAHPTRYVFTSHPTLPPRPIRGRIRAQRLIEWDVDLLARYYLSVPSCSCARRSSSAQTAPEKRGTAAARRWLSPAEL